ncbi:MAG: efflux RND transporter periplasmic adaptor subunit [Pseudomonadota bacterium]
MTIAATCAIVGVAAGVVVFGRGVLADRAAAVGKPEAAPIVTVAVAPLRFEDGYETDRRFPGQVQAGQRTVMAFEAAGEVAEIMVDEGDRVEAGAPVARLDTRLLEAERDRLIASRAAMEAQAELARRTTDRREALRDRGHASSQALDDITLQLAEATARIAEIDAAIAAIDVRIDKAVLTAPFDAYVAERMIDTGAMASPGAPVASLVEAEARRFRVGLSPEVAADLSADRIYEARFAGRLYPVALSAVLPELDPATRTRVAMFDFFPGDAPALRATGELTLPTTRSATGAWAPVSALRDGPQGLWLLTTVRQTEDGDIAAVEAVEVVHAETERVFVRGTFRDGDLVIVDGAHRIAPGQMVVPVPIGADEPLLSLAVAEAE